MIARLDHFMAEANAAYYATHDPFADFTTAPEITQAFGEVLGAWASVAWQIIGRPDRVILAEAGPGRGTLMADALRALAKVAPAFCAALQLHLIETSPRLRAVQAKALPGATWHDTIDTLPDGPTILLANEFLDALPIRQFRRRGDGWAEHHITGTGIVERPAEPRPDQAADGDVIEICEPAHALIKTLAARFRRHPGVALFLDYGPETSAPGDSLQALCRGQPVEPWAAPGTADLTAHVDFAALAATARNAGAETQGPVPQGKFLAALGLFQRTDRLAQTQSPAGALRLIDAARRLAEPDRMGRLFKAMAVCHPGCPALPGFDAPTGATA
jgi:NADH dehydrogenase [ubiquinone] 1 alpha subcomplex assembly factor 7